MDKRIFSGKTKEEAISNAKIALQDTEDNFYVKELETKKGLFKGKTVEIEVITKDDIITFIKEYLQKIIYDMGIGVHLEIKTRTDHIVINILSDNNSLLIGKNGRTMDALSVVLNQAIKAKFDVNFKFVLDVGDYKEHHEKQLERLAKSVAREVKYSKVEAKLEPMNSYERRIIHNTLTNHKYVYTESTGEEPNRCVVIKPKEV